MNKCRWFGHKWKSPTIKARAIAGTPYSVELTFFCKRCDRCYTDLGSIKSLSGDLKIVDFTWPSAFIPGRVYVALTEDIK